MIPTFTIDTSKLLDFVRKLKRIDSKSVVADTLNELGNSVKHRVITNIVNQTGLDYSKVEQVVQLSPATGRRLNIRIRIREKALQDALGEQKAMGRKWEKPNREFDEKLVNVRTMRDDKVCPVCEQIAEEGPYSLEEINRLKIVHPHFLNTHFNCRCQLVPFAPKKRLEMTQSSIIPDLDNVVKMTIGQMAEQISKTAKASFKVQFNRSVR